MTPLSRGLAALAVTALLHGTSASSASVTYDAALGSLPEAQGWTFQNPQGVVLPSVSAGELHQGPTGVLEMQWWQRNDVPLSFTAGFAMVVDMRVETSGFLLQPEDGSQRVGFFLDVIDGEGRRAALGISQVGVSLNTDRDLLASNGIPLTGVATTDRLHRYVVRAQGGTFTLSMDGAVVGSTPVGSPVFAAPATWNLVIFGDETNAVGSETFVRRLAYGDPAAALAESPAPAMATHLELRAWPASAGGAEFAIVNPAGGPVRVRLFDVAGALVRDLGEAPPSGGEARLRWDGRGDSGAAAPAGLYFALASTRTGRVARKVLLRR